VSADTLNNLLAEPSPSGQGFVNSSDTAFTQTVRNFRLTANASEDVTGVDVGSRDPALNCVGCISIQMNPFPASMLISSQRLFNRLTQQ
jgi:hypothetical protein